MADHYFTADPESRHDEREIDFDVFGRRLSFVTDAGVFSKHALDFGTRLLISQLPHPLEGYVLDVGCGYGPIGIAIKALSPGAFVTMVDVNRRALELTEQNARRNGLSGVEVVASDGLRAVKDRTFDWIVTNPPVRAGKRIVYRIFEESFHHLSETGQFWLVMRKKQGAPSAVKKLHTLFSEVTIAHRAKGYAVIRCQK